MTAPDRQGVGDPFDLDGERLALALQSTDLGKGASFTVRLPMWSDATVWTSSGSLKSNLLPELAGNDGAENRLNGLKIVVVDDNSDARLLLETILKRDGARIATCVSGKEALDTVKTFRPDVVISDILMPEMDGYTFLNQLRALGSEDGGGNIPVVALTAFARGSESVRIHQAGFQLHLSKPIDPSELVRAIAELVRGTR